MEKARIVEAMEALKNRRDAGVPVHTAISEVAADFEVSASALKIKAEQSWGAPLETDRERNAAHFEFVDRKAEIADRTKAATFKIWEAVKPAYRQEAAMLKRCRDEFEKALDRSDIEHLGHREFAREVFSAELERLNQASGAIAND